MDCPKRNCEDIDMEYSSHSIKRYKRAIDSSAEELICPLTLELPVDPVTAEDGKVYERMAIKKHIAKNRSDLKSPITNEPMGKRLFPALQVRNVIEELVGSGAIDGDKATRWNQEMDNRKKVVALQQRAQDGDTDAMYKLAKCYHYGKGTKKDTAAAYSWYKKASDGGHVAGTAMAGMFLVFGLGVESNNVLGMVLVGRALEAGSDVAAFYLGEWFCTGDYHGLPQDLVQGKMLLRKVVHGTCEHRHLLAHKIEEASNILRELDDPAVIAPEQS